MEDEIQIPKEFGQQITPIDWKGILKEIDFLSIKILDHIYLKDLLTLHKLSRSLQEYRISTKTIRNRLDRLSQWGLIDIVKGSNPLCIMKKLKVEPNIKKLIILGYGKFEVERK